MQLQPFLDHRYGFIKIIHEENHSCYFVTGARSVLNFLKRQFVFNLRKKKCSFPVGVVF